MKNITLTASEAAKKSGFKSLKEVAELNEVTTATLNNYFNDNKQRFVNTLFVAAIKKVQTVEQELNPKNYHQKNLAT